MTRLGPWYYFLTPVVETESLSTGGSLVKLLVQSLSSREKRSKALALSPFRQSFSTAIQGSTA